MTLTISIRGGFGIWSFDIVSVSHEEIVRPCISEALEKQAQSIF